MKKGDYNLKAVEGKPLYTSEEIDEIVKSDEGFLSLINELIEEFAKRGRRQEALDIIWSHTPQGVTV